ncbi:hypothetical protein [Sphingobium sp. B2]|uniref:hypothetical protein n=1 Tax=Sphingobium sp. B2 TaxID=2583228 RepID=UPI0011A68CF1|nr:hypothetical protein [Sphingobium sp. B2]
MITLRLSRDIWLMLAMLSAASAFFRYFGLSPIVYTICYVVLTVLGLGTATYLTLQARRSVRIDSISVIATIAPALLLFIDLPSSWRVICLLVIALIAMLEWKSRLAGGSIS